MIAVGEVRHARSRPRRHAFRYPAYFMRLPMRHVDEALQGRRFLSRNRFNLLSFHDADHGDRRSRLPLAAWIDGLLAGEGIVDADGEIWLHTFPRVLGYAFKPVSFWFCHRADGALRAVVCEVNNTFGERHCYLLAHGDGRPIVDGEEMAATKVFHVSPFCSATGRYRFRFAHRRDRVVARIEYDEQGDAGVREPLITTSLSGRLQSASDRALWSAFIRMPLFSFGVIARIHWQAVQLWWKRTPFFSKPEPPAVEVSR
jgi:DUF1365 family protein